MTFGFVAVRWISEDVDFLGGAYTENATLPGLQVPHAPGEGGGRKIRPLTPLHDSGRLGYEEVRTGSEMTYRTRDAGYRAHEPRLRYP